MILCGDAPLVTTGSLRAALDLHRGQAAEVTVITAVVPDPSGLGRIVRGSSGRFLRIVEESKAHPGRRYLPEADKKPAPQPAAASEQIQDPSRIQDK